MPRVISAFKQFFDDSGNPLVDGWLRFTVSGTNNTDKNTFADSSETIANANPLQLDAAGRCPNVFGSGSYRVVSFVDAAGSPGTQIQQKDPVGGSAGTGAFEDWNDLSIYPLGKIVTGEYSPLLSISISLIFIIGLLLIAIRKFKKRDF